MEDPFVLPGSLIHGISWQTNVRCAHATRTWLDRSEPASGAARQLAGLMIPMTLLRLNAKRRRSMVNGNRRRSDASDMFPRDSANARHRTGQYALLPGQHRPDGQEDVARLREILASLMLI